MANVKSAEVLHARSAGVGLEAEEQGMRMPWRSRQRGAWSPWLLQGFFDPSGVVSRLDAGVVGAGKGVSGRSRYLCRTLLCAVWKQWDIVCRYPGTLTSTRIRRTALGSVRRMPCACPWPIRPS